jgi:hypothetical protein
MSISNCRAKGHAHFVHYLERNTCPELLDWIEKPNQGGQIAHSPTWVPVAADMAFTFLPQKSIPLVE